MENRKVGLLTAFIKSFTNLRFYKYLVQMGGGRIFLYTLLISILVPGVLVGLPLYYNMNQALEVMQDTIDREIPDFEVKNGQFSIERDYQYDEYGIQYVYMTGRQQNFEALESELSGYGVYFLISKDSMIIKANTERNVVYWSDYSSLNIDKSSLDDFMDIINIFFVVLVILIIIIYLIAYYISAVIFAAIASLFSDSKIFEFRHLFRMAVFLEAIAMIIIGILINTTVPVGFLFFIVRPIGILVVMNMIMNRLKNEPEFQMNKQYVHTDVQQNFYGMPNDNQQNGYYLNQGNGPSGYNQNQGYDPNRYNQNQGYDPNRYNQNQGYDPNGYNQNQGYGPNGYNQNQGYNPNSYNSDGYNQNQGYDPSGYNQNQGNDPNEYNQNRGYDSNEYNQNQVNDQNGYNHVQGNDLNGYHQTQGNDQNVHNQSQVNDQNVHQENADNQNESNSKPNEQATGDSEHPEIRFSNGFLQGDENDDTENK